MQKWSKLDLENAHKHCYENKDKVPSSSLCGCFHCLSIFQSSDIHEDNYILDTALCPTCGIDAVLTDNCGIEISAEFLKVMEEYWFSH